MLMRYYLIIDFWLFIYSLPDSLLESKAQKLPGHEARTFSSAAMKGCTRALSSTDDLSVLSRLCFFQSYPLLTFHVIE